MAMVHKWRYVDRRDTIAHSIRTQFLILISSSRLCWQIIDYVPLEEITRVSEMNADFFESGGCDKREAVKTEGSATRKAFAQFQSEDSLPMGWSREARSNFEWTEGTHAFTIHTEEGKHNHGKVFCFRCKGAIENDRMIALLKHEGSRARVAFIQENRWTNARAAAGKFAEHPIMQVFMTFLIFAAFAVTVIEAQLRPQKGGVTYMVLYYIDMALTVVFVFELAINLFAHWFLAFWKNGWYIFDLLIVSLSVAAILLEELPAVKQIRLFRTLRVVKSLR